MKNIFSRIIAQITAAVSLILIPSSAFATVTLCTLAQQAVGYFNMAVKVIIGLAVVVFVYNIFRYFFMDRENNKERGMYLLWGIIGFAVILCFWGLVNLVYNTFSLDNAAPSGFSNLFGGGSGSSGSNSSPCSTSSAPPNNTGV
jgi:heme/copper-type cytochrome/quinol oxidase subunit 4